MKRLLALLLCLSLLLPVFAFAEDEEEDIDFNDLMEQEDVDVDDEGNIVDPDSDDFSEEALRELAENVITGESVDPSELYLNENLPEDVINILLLGLDVKGTKLAKSVCGEKHRGSPCYTGGRSCGRDGRRNC